LSGAARITAFVAVIALVFVGAVAAGGAIDPDARDGADDMASHTEAAEAPAHGEATEETAHPVRGLAIAADDLRVVVADAELRRGRTEQVAFRVVDTAGETVRDFDVEHERRMHLIVVRRDLTGFQHLHPTMAADGTWTAPLRLDEAGSYRLFADFTHGGEPYTLASDLRVDGAADLRALPAAERTATSDRGYDVALDAAGTRLDFTITRDGRPVEVEPYLGAGGHLVALREGDLAFLHVHPEADGPSFEATFPTAGRYRLFLQFKHAGRVNTVAFTHEVAR
jgi:hypothetical protein